jgi:hypothetical protein
VEAPTGRKPFKGSATEGDKADCGRLATKKRNPTLFVMLPLAFVVSMLLTDSARATLCVRYTIFFLGLPVGEIETAKTFGASTYQISVDARVTGLATVISNFKMNMKSNGTIHKDVVQPSHFFAEETGSGQFQSMRITLVGGSVKSTEIAPAVKDMDQRVPLLEEHKRNIVDPASSLMMTIPSGQDQLGPSACNRTFRMFDGFSRSDIKLEFIKTDDVIASGYTGKVSVCSVRYIPIAGLKAAATMTTFMQNNTQMEMRLAPIPDTQQLVVVSATIPLPVGIASFQLEELQIELPVPGLAR